MLVIMIHLIVTKVGWGRGGGVVVAGGGKRGVEGFRGVAMFTPRGVDGRPFPDYCV